MSTPVVKVANGGIPISVTAFGAPMTVANNGFGIAVTIVATGGLPVSIVPTADSTILTADMTTVTADAFS